MIIKSKFKVAKRLGAPIFEKTQTQKFALSKARTESNIKRRRRGTVSDFAKQLREKQKMRFMYGISERQFRNYVREAIAKKGSVPAETLFALVESRLDNVVYRLGLAHTRALARQLVSHGHITVNNRRMNVPSHIVRIDDVVAVRKESKDKAVFAGRLEAILNAPRPEWVSFDSKAFSGVLKQRPTATQGDLLFDLNSVIEYYSR